MKYQNQVVRSMNVRKEMCIRDRDTSERPSVRQELKQIKSERELRIEKNKQRSKARGQSFSKNPV